MVVEPKKPNLAEIARVAEYIENGGKVHCGHDFWDKKVEVGDIVLCTRCHQYFAKVNGFPWVLKENTYWGGPGFKYRFNSPAHTNHLNDICYVPVQPRVTLAGT